MSSVSSPKDEPFSLHTTSLQSNKEQLTPHKLSLLVLIAEYHDSQKFTPGIDDEEENADSYTLSESERRQVMTMLLDLLQSPDLDLSELKVRLMPALHPTMMEKFEDRLEDFKTDKDAAVVDFIETLGSMVMNEENDCTIHRASVVGIFIRRLWLSFSQMSFSQLTSFLHRLHSYLTGQPVMTYSHQVAESAARENAMGDGERRMSESFGGSLTDSLMSARGGPLGQSGLMAADLSAIGVSGEREKMSFSQKQAEFFISQQAGLLSLDENKALSPKQLQKKLSAMLEQHPDMAEAHFLSYLNNLRVKEYCTAVHNLYHYFDRNAQLTGEATGNSKRPEDEISRRYAALNLAALHFNFNHKREAKAALLEAIRMAQESNDHVCLQHALSWLNLLAYQEGDAGMQMERSVSKSHDLSLSYLTSLGVQALARHNAFATAAPASVFDYMMKSNVINCQNSLYGMMSISAAQRSALWSYYGNRECAAMCAQTVLCLDTQEKGVFYNGESICIALCILARHHADRGDHSCATEILQHARQRFPPHTQHAHLWQACEQSLTFEHALLTGKWGDAERAAHNLRALKDSEGRLHLARLLGQRGEVTASLKLLHSLKDEFSDSKELTPDFLCRVLLAMVDVLMTTDNHTASLPHLTHCLTHATSHHLHYLAAVTTLYLAVVQMRMKLPGQALKLVETATLEISSHGGPYDRARLLYAYARCKVAAAQNGSIDERKTALLGAVTQMTTVVTLFQSLEVTHRVKDALYYQARLYHQLGYTAERNRCAYRFKQLDQQMPTLSKISVHAV
ncbi:anaphase-promoting complex subunit 5-like [Littorina saxatilis]|uniref:Anaphase-promoting complex subunit 5 n=1 Tax=Littorina saxatilis TaxID=31220 RepID=A0AAN9B720_9CAEN